MIYHNNFISKVLMLALIICCSCVSTSTITDAERQNFKPSVLSSGYDLTDMRIDIIRQTKDATDINGNTVKEDVAYSPIGYKLGNGMFYDLNGNLAFLISDLFNLTKDDNYSLIDFHGKETSNYKTTFTKINNSHTITKPLPFPLASQTTIDFTDTLINVKHFLSNYKIKLTDTTLTYNGTLFKTTIQKTANGFIQNSLFDKSKYIQSENTIYLDNNYEIVNKGNVIEIYSRFFSKTGSLLYKIIRSNNKIEVFHYKYKEYEIDLTENKIDIIGNSYWKKTFRFERL